MCIYLWLWSSPHLQESYESNDFVLIPAAFPEPDNKEPDREVPPTYWWELPLNTITASTLVLSRSVVSDSVTPWTVACQAPLSIGFSRQEYWRGLPFPPPRDLPNPGIEPTSPTSLEFPALAGRFFTISTTWVQVL